MFCNHYPATLLFKFIFGDSETNIFLSNLITIELQLITIEFLQHID